MSGHAGRRIRSRELASNGFDSIRRASGDCRPERIEPLRHERDIEAREITHGFFATGEGLELRQVDRRRLFCSH